MKTKTSLGVAAGLAFLATALASSPADAQESWFVTAEAGAAVPLNRPHQDIWGIGGELGVGVFRSLMPKLALGLRLNAGALIAENEPENAGQGGMGFGMASLVVRLRPFGTRDSAERATGFWLEGAAGPGIVESNLRMTLSPGLGYTFPVGQLGVGPFGRYIQIIEGDERYGGKDGRLAVVGVELVFLDARDGAGGQARGRAGDRDGDGLLDDRDACPDEPETYNGVHDHDGCPDDDETFFVKDRFVIDERVFFDFDKSELLPTGKVKLDKIAELYASEKSWVSLRVQGHTDSRGSEEYNEDLSRQRAAKVREYLVSKGIPANLLDVEAYGERYPANPGAVSESEHQKNRRVEFVITRKAP